MYRIKVENNQTFIRAMQKLGITCGIHYNAIHLNKIYSKHIFNNQKKLPLSAKEQKTTVSIPFHENLGDDSLQYIIEKVNEFKDI